MIWSSSEGRSADKVRELLLFGRGLRLPFLEATSQQMFSACSLDQRGAPDDLQHTLLILRGILVTSGLCEGLGSCTVIGLE